MRIEVQYRPIRTPRWSIMPSPRRTVLLRLARPGTSFARSWVTNSPDWTLASLNLLRTRDRAKSSRGPQLPAFGPQMPHLAFRARISNGVDNLYIPKNVAVDAPRAPERCSCSGFAACFRFASLPWEYPGPAKALCVRFGPCLNWKQRKIIQNRLCGVPRALR